MPTSSDSIDVSILIPWAGEPEKTLRNTIARLKSVSFTLNSEIIVIDDSGGTGHPFEPLGDTVTLIRNEVNLGKGASLRKAIQRSRGEVIILTDCDAPFSDHDLSSFIMSSRHSDIVLTSVRVPIDRNLQWSRELASIIYRLVWRLLGGPCRDPQSPLKRIPGKWARARVQTWRLDGFAFDIELLTTAELEGVEISDVQVLWRDTRASLSLLGSFRRMVGMLGEMTSVRLRASINRLGLP